MRDLEWRPLRATKKPRRRGRGLNVEATESHERTQKKGQRASGKERKERGPEDPAERKAADRRRPPASQPASEPAQLAS